MPAGTTLLHDMLAPSALAFQPHYLDLGDTPGRVLVITGYPPRVGDAWLARLAGMPGVSLSVHVQPTDPAALVKAVNASITEFASRLAAGGAPILRQRNEQSLADAQALLRKIDQEQQTVGRVTVALLVMAPDAEELTRRVRQVQAAIAAAGMRAFEASYQQESGLRAVGPWCHLPADVGKAGGRHLPVETIAAMYPFVRAGLNEAAGIVFGRDGDGGLVLLDLTKQSNGRINGNISVLGGSGGGKSTAAKVLILRALALGWRVLVIDPEAEYTRLAKALGMPVVDVGGGGGRINPLHIDPTPDEPDEDEEATGPVVQGALTTYLQRVRTFFRLYLPSLTDVEHAILEKAAVAAYAAKGVTWETDPSTIKVWPTIADVYAEVVKRPDAERLAVLLESAAQGADAALWAGQSTVHVGQDPLVVLNIKRLGNAEGKVRRAQFFNVLGYAWDLVRQGRAANQYTLLVVDEAWVLIDPEAPQALEHLRDWAKRIRKYGPLPIGAVMAVVTQNIGDFLDPAVARLGAPVISNASVRILTRQEGRDLEALSGLFRLTEAEHSLLASAKTGEALMLAGNDRVRLRVEVAPHESELIFAR